VHFDTDVVRAPFSWVRGTNAYLPPDIAVQWAAVVDACFHARGCAISRRYLYTLLSAPVRPALEQGLVGWTHRTLSESCMGAAAQVWLGEHDFSAFRSSQCQSHTPVKTLQSIVIQQRSGPLPESVVWTFEFEANAFLHHMVRNMMGMLVMIGSGAKPASWAKDVLESRNRAQAAPTFAPDGLTFLGPVYGPPWAARLPALDRHCVELNR
jgi:tRNA pseudouridine38-40 synthase